MFVIPCKFTKDSNIIDLVFSISKYHPNDIISVHDSNSDDKTYIDKIKNIPNLHILYNNSNYVDSAIWNSYNKFIDEDFFYVIHDSSKLLGNLDEYKKYDFTSYAWFKNTYITENVETYIKTVLSSNNIDYNIFDFYCLFGIMFFTNRYILNKLKNEGLNKILPIDKDTMCASETIWGAFLKKINIDITKNSLCGNTNNFFNKETKTFEHSVLKKYILIRK